MQRGCVVCMSVPKSAKLGDLEAMLAPQCKARVLAIERMGEAMAIVEFEGEMDAAACVGEHRLHGKLVSVQLREPIVPAHAGFSMPAEGSAEAALMDAKRAEAKKEKEKRLNRVGLSYRCGRCGKPKKGHVCIVADGEGADEVADPSPAALPPARTPPQATISAPQSANGSWGDLDSDNIFHDIKSVLHGTPGSNDVKGTRKSARRAAANEESGRPQRKVAATGKQGRGGREEVELLEEVEIAMHRPPALITPDDQDGARPGGPSSLPSASDMFSPGVLMHQLLGTPTPGGPAATSIGGGLNSIGVQGISPGSLNELGNLLQSPLSVPASAKKSG